MHEIGILPLGVHEYLAIVIIDDIEARWSCFRETTTSFRTV
jgi:hypothetical protein